MRARVECDMNRFKLHKIRLADKKAKVLCNARHQARLTCAAAWPCCVCWSGCSTSTGWGPDEKGGWLCQGVGKAASVGRVSFGPNCVPSKTQWAPGLELVLH